MKVTGPSGKVYDDQPQPMGDTRCVIDDKTLQDCRDQWLNFDGSGVKVDGPGFKGIFKIWADGVCIYDTSPQRPDESDQEYQARLDWSKGNI